MAANFSDLVSYFEDLASKHKSIRHSELEKHFYRFELEEVLTGMCNELNYPAFILEAYDYRYSDPGSDDIRKRRSGGFILLDLTKDPKDFDRIHEIWDEMEAIGDDFLMKMRADKESRLYPVLTDFDINNCDGVPLSVTKLGQHGVRVSFNLGCAVNLEIDEERWM